MKLAPGEAVITQPALLHARTAPSDLVGYANENGAYVPVTCLSGSTWAASGLFGGCCSTAGPCGYITGCARGSVLLADTTEYTCTFTNAPFCVSHTVFDNLQNTNPISWNQCDDDATPLTFYKDIAGAEITSTTSIEAAPIATTSYTASSTTLPLLIVSSSDSYLAIPPPPPSSSAIQSSTVPPSAISPSAISQSDNSISSLSTTSISKSSIQSTEPSTISREHGRSSAMIAGAVIGVILGLSIIAAIIFWFIRLKRSGQKQQRQISKPQAQIYELKPELSSRRYTLQTTKTFQNNAMELPSIQVSNSLASPMYTSQQYGSAVELNTLRD